MSYTAALPLHRTTAPHTLAAAYPDAAGVSRFTRTFTWDGGSRINVADSVALATVKSPGPSGSIEEGPEEQRGHVLKASAPAALTDAFEVALELPKSHQASHLVRIGPVNAGSG